MMKFARASALAASALLISSALAYAETGGSNTGAQDGSGASQRMNEAAHNAGAAAGAAEEQAKGAADQSKTTLKQIQNTERSRDVTRTQKAHGAGEHED